MAALHQARPLTDAIVAALAVVVATGDGEQPDGSGWQGTPGASSFVPYAVVHPIVGGGPADDNTIEDPHADSESLYQVSCYGATRQQCEFVSDKVFPVMVALRPVLTGRAVMFVEAEMEGGARRDDSIQPPIWMGAPRYRFSTTPT